MHISVAHFLVLFKLHFYFKSVTKLVNFRLCRQTLKFKRKTEAGMLVIMSELEFKVVFLSPN